MRFFFFSLLVVFVIFRVIFPKSDYKDGDRVRITTTLYQEPLNYGSYKTLKVKGLRITLPSFKEVGYGDRVVIEGTVEKDKLKNAKLIEVVKTKGYLYKLRQKIIEFYRNNLPEPSASLIAGITLGSKSDIPQSFWENLKSSGLAHVVVASGTNITFVASFLISVLALYLPRKKALPIVFIGIWFYAALSGFEAPIIRASIMTTLTIWAQGAGRIAFSWSILSLSALVMLAINPYWIGDLGFILSFVSTASLMLFQGRINKFLKFIPQIVREGLSTSIAAQIGVSPIIFVSFGQFNILSPIANALVLWTVPLIMVIGAISGVLGVTFPVLGKIVLYLSYPLTWWFSKVVGLF